MSFIFVSYSRKDQNYVGFLVQALQSHRLPVWLDDRINYGTTWPRVIQDHLEQCEVFLLVMSPRSEDSHWVQCELSLALELKKPIFPLLLEGRRWLSVAAIQMADVKGGKLPPADFFDTIRKYFASATSTATSVSVQDVVEEQIPMKPPVMEPKPQKLATSTDDLSSEKGVDYTRLRDLLREGKWRDADNETCKVMMRAVGIEPGERFVTNGLQNFPCTDLKTIDGLWTKYSKGHFGFSVQKEVWQKYGSPTSSSKKWDQLCIEVGWKSAGSYITYSKLKAEPQFSSRGEFPIGMFVYSFGEWQWVIGLGFLFSRIQTCKL